MPHPAGKGFAYESGLPFLILIVLFSMFAGCSQDRASEPQTGFRHYEGPEFTDAMSGWLVHHTKHENPSVAYRWLEIILEATARRVDRIGARPTVIARENMIACEAMFGAWACYDDKAVGTITGDALRRPAAERTTANKEKAIAIAIVRCLEDLFPEDLAWIHETARKNGVEPSNTTTDVTTPEGIGNTVAAAILAYRHADGANQLGDAPEGDGKPYSDTTGYTPRRKPGETQDPDHWMNIPFAHPDGSPGTYFPKPLTPHWGKVKTIGYEDPDAFRTPGPPKAGSRQLRLETDECIDANASLSLRQKAIVEFMRDGPRSTGQSGHWLRFAQDLSRRDAHDLDMDVKLFFSVANMAHDSFVMCWEEKYRIDSSRPYWYVRWYYTGQMIRGYAGPCQGFKMIPASEWHPYSPAVFVTPPFPGYPSGHSTVSGACAKILELFSGGDRFEFVAIRTSGELTETGCSTAQMQATEGLLNREVDESREVLLPLPTFSEAARMAAESRLLGGYHIRTDNDDGLDLGRKMAVAAWPRYQGFWEGTAPVLK